MPSAQEVVNWLQFVLAAAGVALLTWGYYLQRARRQRLYRRHRAALLVVLGVLGFAAYFNFGELHSGRFIHTWDMYHYFMGAKYFPELRYERLYDCTVVADAEEFGARGIEARIITDLRTNRRVPAYNALSTPERCTGHFTPERWEAFKADLAYFRGTMDTRRWTLMLKDHGFNATPAWNLLGHALANSGPATDARVVAVGLVDWLFIAAMFAMIAWAFGWRVTMVAMLFFGTNIPGGFYWIGGSLLRQDWLFWMVGSICLLKKDKPFLAGAFIAYATLLRLFPGLVILGPVCAFVEAYRREKRLDARLLRYFAGGIAATVVLVASSAALFGGPQSWIELARNSAKHAATPLTNHMGLRTVASYHPETTGAQLEQRNAVDPWAKWKEARLANFEHRKPYFYAACLLYLALLYAAIARSGAQPWLAAALATGMIAVGAELTAYYYAFFLGLILAFGKRMEAAILLLVLNLAWMLGERVLAALGRPTDERHVAMSVMALVVYAVILWRFTRPASSGSTAPAS
jgi:hypothetical protein